MTWFRQMKIIVNNLNKHRRSDREPGTKKETKFYKNSTDNCWLCGLDVAAGHTTKTCWTQADGHKEEPIPQNPRDGNMKDFQFSSYT